MLKFQTFSLIKKNNKSGSWSEEEDHILTKIVKFLSLNSVIIQFNPSNGAKSLRNFFSAPINYFSEILSNVDKGGIIILILVKLRESGQHNKIRFY